MKIYAIIKEYENVKDEIAYLFYYEDTDSAYIEIPKDKTEWEVPLILDHFVRDGSYIVPSSWTYKWACNRVIPADRQNIASILKENNMSEYNVYKLLFISDGRCAQDDCYIKLIREADLPESIKERQRDRISNAQIYKDTSFLISLESGEMGVLDIADVTAMETRNKHILRYAHLLAEYEISCGGSAINWNDDNEITYLEMKEKIRPLGITEKELMDFVLSGLVSTTEATQMLGCSRQNLDDMVKRGRLKPVCSISNNKLYKKSDLRK